MNEGSGNYFTCATPSESELSTWRPVTWRLPVSAYPQFDSVFGITKAQATEILRALPQSIYRLSRVVK